jgi:hypothetical protein
VRYPGKSPFRLFILPKKHASKPLSIIQDALQGVGEHKGKILVLYLAIAICDSALHSDPDRVKMSGDSLYADPGSVVVPS